MIISVSLFRVLYTTPGLLLPINCVLAHPSSNLTLPDLGSEIPEMLCVRMVSTYVQETAETKLLYLTSTTDGETIKSGLLQLNIY